MKPSHPSIPASLVISSKQALDSYAAPIDGLQMALLTTPDGFEIASLRNRSELQVNRLAAMASSLMAMGRAVGREIQVSTCNRLIFEAEGNVVVFQTIGGSFPCILCLVLRPGAVLGRALWSAAEISQTLAGQR
jgi:predicted regulator of Ras-like GTPase activity (Roadblock/LC7/MglB family)